MNTLYYYEYDNPVGKIGITEEDGYITNVFFTYEEPTSIKTKKTGTNQFEISETPLIAKTAQQLKEYFDGERKEFDLPLKLDSTDFMVKDWEALMTIPYGETCSYKDIAIKIGNPKAFRAVGMANNRNPIAIVIPCHRVIGADGKLVGYGGGLPIKEYLLNLEQQNMK